MNNYRANTAVWFAAEEKRKEKQRMQTALLNIKSKIEQKAMVLMHEPVGAEVSINVVTDVPGIHYSDVYLMRQDLFHLAETIEAELYRQHISVDYDSIRNIYTITKSE